MAWARRTTTRIVKLAALACTLWSVCLATGLAERGQARIVAEGSGGTPAADGPRTAGTPVAANDHAVTNERLAVDVPVLRNDRDPDGDALRVVGVTQGANGSVLVNGDDSLRYWPHEGFTGLDEFAYTISDGRGGLATATVSIRVEDVAAAPVAEDQEVETDEDTALAITLLGSDADGDPLQFRIQRPPAHGALRGTPPDLSYLPNADYHGIDGFVFAVEDGHGGSDPGTVSIRIHPVKDVPIARDDQAETDEEVAVDVAVLRNDRDPDGQLLRVVGVTQGANGSVLVNGDDTLRYWPDEGFTGLDGFAYTIANSSGETATATVSVRVQDVASAPVAEDQKLETDEDTALAITLLGSDADGDRLQFRIQRPPAHGTLRGTPPDLSYLPVADYHGTDGFVFVVEDGHGGSDPGAVSIRIHPVDDAPIARDDQAETDEEVAVDVAVLRNDRDPDGNSLRVVSVTQGANGSVLVNGDDTLRYWPDEGFVGLDGFAYTIAGSSDETATATVSVRVKDVASAPVAADQEVETDEDTAVAITLLGSDADGDPLQFRIQRLPAHGSLRGTLPDLSYLPAVDYHGTDGFGFVVEDGRGGSDTGEVSIRIRPVDDVPAARDDEAATQEDVAVDIVVLGNDVDPDGDLLRVVGVTQGANGLVLVNGDDSIRYWPHEGFTGLDGFAYTIAGGSGETATATVSVRVERAGNR